MRILKQNLEKDPRRVSATVRSNAHSHPTVGHSELETPSMYTFFANQVPMGKAKSVAYLVFLMCSVFDLMERGKWHQAEALLALGLCAAEAAALRTWRWEAAWLLTHQPSPPWHHVSRPPPISPLDAAPKLSETAWTAATIAAVKDLVAMDDTHRRSTGKAPKGAGKDHKDKGSEE